MKRLISSILLIMTFLAFSSIQRVEAEDFEDIVLDINYNHIKYAPPKLRDKDIVRSFAAFVVCFDGDDDDDGDGVPDKWGIPHWIAYEIKRTDPQPGKPFDKPDELITDEDLFEKGIAPEEESYDVPEKLMLENPKSPQLGHVKGLLCTGSHASRLGERAYWNVHTVLNVCPQKKKLNMGIWKDLDQKTLEWADEYGSVWVMTGPIVFNNKPSLWLGKNGEVSVAVPDAFFKILVREVGGYPEVLAFIYPQEGIAYKRTKGYDHTPYLTSVDVIEALTGLDFFPKLAEDTETEIEKVISIRLWE